MTNRFYNTTFSPSVGALAQSAALKASFTAITSGMQLVQDELDRLQGITGITSIGGFPASFSGNALKYLRVNAAESAVEFVAGQRMNVRTIGGTAYTLVATDANYLLVFSNASPITVTVPAGVYTTGDLTCIEQGAAGQVTLVADAGATVDSSDGLMATRKQSAQIGLFAKGASSFTLIGERNAPSAGVALLAQANVFTKSQSVTPVALTDAATIATDASLSNTFTVLLTAGVGATRQLGNPTNLVHGCIYTWRAKQSSGGGNAMTYGSKFDWGLAGAPTLSTAANKIDFFAGQYFSDIDKIIMGTCLKGYG